jgi:hypothetical protein
MNRNNALDFPSNSSLSELHVPSDEINGAEGSTTMQGQSSTVNGETLPYPSLGMCC